MKNCYDYICKQINSKGETTFEMVGTKSNLYKWALDNTKGEFKSFISNRTTGAIEITCIGRGVNFPTVKMS